MSNVADVGPTEEKKKKSFHREKGLKTATITEWAGAEASRIASAVDEEIKYVTAAAVNDFAQLPLPEQFDKVTAAKKQHREYMASK